MTSRADFTTLSGASVYLTQALLVDFESSVDISRLLASKKGLLSPELSRFLEAISKEERSEEEAKDISVSRVDGITEKGVLRHMERFWKLQAEQPKRPPRPEIPLHFGTLWRPKGLQSPFAAPPFYLVLDTPADDDLLVQVAPASLWPALAGPDDFRVKSSVHHPECFVALGHEHPIPRELLTGSVGILEPEEVEALTHYRRRTLGGEYDVAQIEAFAGRKELAELPVYRLYQEYIMHCTSPYSAEAWAR